MRLVLAVVVTLLVCEAAVRAAAARIPEPLVWYHASAQVKVGQMDELERVGERVDYVIVGSSQSAQGLDPVELSAQLPGRPSVFNAAPLAGYPTVNERFVPDVVVPKLHPRTVLVGVSSNDLETDDRPPYLTSPAVDPSLSGEIGRSAAGISALVRYRASLADPTNWAAIANGSADGEVNFYRRELIGPSGRWDGPTNDRCDTSPGMATAVSPATEPPWTPDAVNLAAFWRMVDRVSADGVTVTIVVLPQSDCALDILRSGSADAQARADLRSEGEQRGLRVIDVTDQVHERDLFSDFGHLNRAGATVFTALVAEQLRQG